MRIGIFSDVHANLPACQAILSDAQIQECERLIHLGDSIALGPYPAETLQLLLETLNLTFVKGNHDAYYASGLGESLPVYMGEGEILHETWTHAQLGDGLRDTLDDWPYIIWEEIEGVPFVFTHYALQPNGEFKQILPNPLATDFDRLFEDFLGNTAVFYGHTHIALDVQSTMRYINPGSVGCTPTAYANYVILDVIDGTFTITPRHIPYDDRALLAAFDKRDVPDRAFIRKTFYGGR